MKRFLLFAYNEYYPGGGWFDFKGDFDSVSEAESAFDRDNECAEIIDTDTKQPVRELSVDGHWIDYERT